jgi:hypothetical protein
MNALALPPAPPLPAEVRERVLQTVVAGSGLRAGTVVAAAAAVVATLAVMTPAALADDVAGINALARPSPASHQSTWARSQSSSISTSQSLAPCRE